jgi:uncharacterized protein YggE
MRLRIIPFALAMLAASAPTTRAQDPSRPTVPPVPQIVTSAQGEARATPDRATVTIGVQTRAVTAADASAQNSRKQRAVIDAIKAKGIPASQIVTSSFNVIPETRYDREGQAAPRTTSYLVSNVVTVDVRRIDQVGPVIDAALAAGANQINSLAFSISAADSVRRVALTDAVTKARLDAEAIARAAGGTLGPLLDVTATDMYSPPSPRPMFAVAKTADAAAAVPVEAGEDTVRASVMARWQFVPGAR